MDNRLREIYRASLLKKEAMERVRQEDQRAWMFFLGVGAFGLVLALGVYFVGAKVRNDTNIARDTARIAEALEAGCRR